MSLAEALIDIQPREVAGSRSSRAFDYQKDWALCKLIELQESEADYLLLCEYHDDIIVLDSSSDPQKVCFFQVKTKKSGHWTLAPLVHRKKGADGQMLPSVLGRLFENGQNFKDWVGDLNFVSNAPFKFKLDDGDTLLLPEFTATQLSESERKKFLKKITEELGDEIASQIDCVFQVSPLSLEESSVHAKGRLEEFLCRTYGGDRHPTTSLYRTLFDEIKRRSNAERGAGQLASIAERKGISKQRFEQFLDCAKVAQDPEEIWRRIESQLQAEGLPFTMIRSLRKEWREYEIARLNPTNESLLGFSSKVEEHCLELMKSNPQAALRDLVRLIEAACSDLEEDLSYGHLRAIALWKFHEEPEIQEIDSESPEEE